MQFYEFKDIEERVILIGVQTSEDEDVAASLDELSLIHISKKKQQKTLHFLKKSFLQRKPKKRSSSSGFFT